MRIANIIMAHKNPGQLERLIRKMEHPMFDLYIHLDKKTSIRNFEYLRSRERVFFITNRIECNWGGYSFVRAILCSMKEVLDSPVRYDFINLMSAQDYPIKPVGELYKYLCEHMGISFISYDIIGNSWWQHAVNRFRFYHFTDYRLKGKYLLQKLANTLMPQRKFPLNLVLYGSADSSWWILSHDAAQYLLDFIESNVKLKRFMQYTWGSDEFLISTILMNSPFSDKIINDNLRYIDWSSGGAHPKILGRTDLEALLETKKFIARKFDITVDADILDMIDMHHKTPVENNYALKE